MTTRQSGGLLDYYGSKDIFADRAHRLIELGISEIGLSYPRRDAQVPMFEKIAAEAIPNAEGGIRCRPHSLATMSQVGSDRKNKYHLTISHLTTICHLSLFDCRIP